MSDRSAWENATCPRVLALRHCDNTGATCRNCGVAAWAALEEHDCCYDCNDRAEQLRGRLDVAAWLAERERYHAEHPICADRSKLSDEVAPDFSLSEHPSFSMLRGGR